MRKWLKGAALAVLIIGTWMVLPGHAQDTTTLLSQFLTQLRAGTFTLGAALSGSKIASPSDGVLTLTNNAGTNFGRLQFGGTTASFPALQRNANVLEVVTADGGAYTKLNTGALATQSGGAIFSSAATITAGSGAGITVNAPGQLQRQVYSVTVASTAFVCAAVTCDVTIATLPNKTIVVAVLAELTQVFACTAVCTTATLSFTVGTSVGGAELLTSVDADAAPGMFGFTDAVEGALIKKASAYNQAGALIYPSAVPASLRMTSGTGNLGNATVTNLSQGSVTFYLITERLP